MCIRDRFYRSRPACIAIAGVRKLLGSNDIRGTGISKCVATVIIIFLQIRGHAVNVTGEMSIKDGTLCLIAANFILTSA